MSLLRLVVAWLVMAALPLQGLAAASMLFCDQAAHSTVTQPGHDHAAHGHGAEHATSHGGEGSPSAEEASVQLAQQQSDASQAAPTMVDDGHACPICASCCNLVALSEIPTLTLDGAAAMSQPLDDPSRVLTRNAPTPDKPPRA